MILLKKAKDIAQHLEMQRETGRKIGFVPTMGALHEGHLSLVREAKNDGQLCVASIFVNPTQFNDPADFEKYPVTIEQDIKLLVQSDCDILFLPSVQEMYPETPPKSVHYDLGYLETILEGKFRPGHFQGVCTVVDRLLKIVAPDNLFMGQKDYQQCMVVERLLEITGLDTVKLRVSPTLREKDGLAMSSRNVRLDPDSRKKAVAISASLDYIREQLTPGYLTAIKAEASRQLTERGFRIDYVEIATASGLKIVDHWDGKDDLVALIAAFIGDVRLIDNMLLQRH